jgi:hypothetical protein
VRCATAAEIAANYAIRYEWSRQTEFAPEVVDQFLLWANGLKGKIERLFVPTYSHPNKRKIGKKLIALARKINQVRNAVVHQGAFSNAKEAKTIIAEEKTFIDTIVGLSIPNFDIKDRPRSK